MSNLKFTALTLMAILSVAGCGTTTQRLATEQLLISDAVDQAVAEIDFSHLADQSVYLDTTFLKSVRGHGFANTEYIVSSIRQQMAAAGCRIQDVRADAKIIVEPRVGALGTDGHEVTYGIPQTGQITSAAAAFSSGAPAIPILPEISFGKSDKQQGVAKIMVFAYDRETKLAVWQSGLKQSESTSTNTWVMGAGPFQRGSIHEGFRFAGRDLRKNRNSIDQESTANFMPDEKIYSLPSKEADPVEEENAQERIADANQILDTKTEME